MKKKTNHIKKYVKANRKGSRDAELENQTGWVSKHKIHAPKTLYRRKLRDNSVEE